MSATIALIVAAGRGTRAPGDCPKQYRNLAGSSVLSKTVRSFTDHDRISAVAVVISPDDVPIYEASTAPHRKVLNPIFGGASRAESVLNGLRALTESHTSKVLIHDAARPMVSRDMISRVVDALDHADGAVPTLAAVDAMRMMDPNGTLKHTVARDGVRRAQTPQGFRLGAIRELLEDAATRGVLHTLADEAETAIAGGLNVLSVEGDPLNFKLTVPEDFTMAERLLAQPDIRTGQGYDVHAFGDGDHVVLCGVRIPHDRGLMGHSDADVGLHTLTDALLGAVAEGDIGRHFPPSDPQWKGVDSAVFLRRAVEIVAERGYRIANVDVTLICEQPKIGPHSAAMITRVAELCGLEPSRVSVKATTTERLGFCGRGEGIAAQAVATVIGVPA